MIIVLVCLLLAFPLMSIAAPGLKSGATQYPVEIQSCNRRVVYDEAPRRAVSNDVNLTEMMVALGLKNRLVGYTGISGISSWKTASPELMRELSGVPELAKQYPSAETLIGVGADFYFAGWNYGMQVGGAITPATLGTFGIKVYELKESCAHVMHMPAATVDDVYDDLRNLGKIFDVSDRAQALVHQMQSHIAVVRSRLASYFALGSAPAMTRVFVYDGGTDRPFSAGALAMPSALIAAAGGQNIMHDVRQSWTAVNWESVVARNPEVIVIIDYGAVTAAQKIQFLLNLPALAKVDAIVHQRFIVLSYEEATPGIHNARAIETLARALHPDAFKP